MKALHIAALIAFCQSGCVAATLGAKAAPVIDAKGDPDALVVGTAGFGYAFSRTRALNLELNVGSSVQQPFLLGESLAYTGYGQTGGWHVGAGAMAEIGGDQSVRGRFFGQYLVPLRVTKRGYAPRRGGKGGLDLFRTRSARRLSLGIGPELNVLAGKSEETRLALGLTLALHWHVMVTD